MSPFRRRQPGVMGGAASLHRSHTLRHSGRWGTATTRFQSTVAKLHMQVSHLQLWEGHDARRASTQPVGTCQHSDMHTEATWDPSQLPSSGGLLLPLQCMICD